MGHGEVYWHEWVKWFLSIAPVQQQIYQTEWPEPLEWKGFYELILDGVAPPWIVEQRAKDSEQQPPKTDEHRIEDPNKVRWMARVYLEKTNARGKIFVDPAGDFWQLCEALPEQRSGPFLWFERFRGSLVGPDNTPDSVRTARGARIVARKPGDST
jgi:hypothetical protein